VTGRKRLTRTKARRKARIPSYGSRSGTGQRISKIQVQIRRCQRCCGRSSRQQRRRASRRRATCSLTSAPGTEVVEGVRAWLCQVQRESNASGRAAALEPQELGFHPGVTCDRTGQSPIVGNRY
jgi:hypothetical protein